MFSLDHASQSHGFVVVSVTENSAELSMTVRQDMVNGLGICHGGILFLLADSAMAYSSNASNQLAVAAAASIDFVAPAQLGDQLTAEATQTWLAGRTALVEVIVTARSGELLAEDTPRTIAFFRGRTSRIGGHVLSDPS